MSKDNPHMKAAIKKYLPDDIDWQDTVWEVRKGTGTFAMYHRYVEIIGARIGKGGVVFNEPQLMHHDGDKTLSILVVGQANENGNIRTEWSFGEVSPANNKNSYPWAMAEKRAKDRVILKLAGLQGHVYSEEEADVFKESKPRATAAKVEPNIEKATDAKLPEILNPVWDALAKCGTIEEINNLAKLHQEAFLAQTDSVQIMIKAKFGHARATLKKAAA